MGVGLVTRAHAPAGSWGWGRWHLVGLSGAAVSGAALTAVRGLRVGRIDAWAIFTVFCAAGMVCTAPQTFAQYLAPTPREWVLIAAVGVFALTAQLLMNHALGFISTATSGAISQLTPVTTLVLGVAFLGEPANGLAVAGTALTLLGVFWATLLTQRTAPSSVALERPRQEPAPGGS
jgi:drug/metabolite transporter (DMT)-like permease